MPSLDVHDETTTGDRSGETTLELLTERITVRELIRSRVYQEVQDYNLRAVGTPFRGLVQPAEIERELNPDRPGSGRGSPERGRG